MLGWIGMNPSKAADSGTDPTWTRGLQFSQRWGFGGQLWINPVCLRSSSPEAAIERLRLIAAGKDPGGLRLMEHNLNLIGQEAKSVVGWICAWGDKGAAMNSVYRCHARTIAILRAGGASRFFAFGVTASGNPKHPLARGTSRIPDDAELREFFPDGRRLGDRVDIRELAR